MSNIPGYGDEGEVLTRDAQGMVRDQHGRVVTNFGFRFYPDNDTWAPPEPELPEDPRDALPMLREKAAIVWESLCLAFMHPIDLVKKRWIDRRFHLHLGGWVRNLEGLVRRTILIAALTLKLAPLKPHKPRPWGVGRFQATYWDDPLTWKTSFVMTQPAGRARRSKVRPQKPRHRPWRLARPYALRIEALRRAIRFHDTHVLRYARRLARLAAFNRRANEPRLLTVPGWSCHPRGPRRPGKHPVSEAMRFAQPLAELGAEFWNEQFVEPG